MIASTGSVYKGQIKDYTETQAQIDFRKPQDIRVGALLPLVGSTAFLMVSDGKRFKLSIPPTANFSRAIMTRRVFRRTSFENIRPDMFLSAILVKRIDPEKDLTIKLDDITDEYAYYQLAVLRKVSESEVVPIRRITFDRVTLYMIGEREYAPDGTIVSDSHYGDWQTYGDVRFPSHIGHQPSEGGTRAGIKHHQDGHEHPIPDTKFVLTKPDGYELKLIGKPPAGSDSPKGSNRPR